MTRQPDRGKKGDEEMTKSKRILWRISLDDGYGGPFNYEIVGSGDISPLDVALAVAELLGSKRVTNADTNEESPITL